MKKVLLALFVLLFITTLFAGAILVNFSAYYSTNDDGIVVVWDTGEETNVQSFVVERSSQQSIFSEVSSEIPAVGSYHHYSFTDKSIFKTNDYVFNYRLKIKSSEGLSYSAEIPVTVNENKISGLKRTWGSIKAMFR